MKKYLNLFLSITSPLAAAPTGWAIYAGVTQQPVFPIWNPAAIAGAIAIISTSIAAGLLIVDILAYNQSMKNKTEREELSMPVNRAWFILAGCVLAEITLSLLIVIIPGAISFGVLVFPLMTAAGVFSFAVRFDLQEREQKRAELREKPKVKRQKLTEKPVEPTPIQQEPALYCAVAGCERNQANPKAKPFGSQAALNAHQRKHKRPIGYAVSFEPITEEQKKD